MRQFCILVGTFLLVYFITPWLSHVVVNWVPIAHPESIGNGIHIIATMVVYGLLRRRYGDRVPPV